MKLKNLFRCLFLSVCLFFTACTDVISIFLGIFEDIAENIVDSDGDGLTDDIDPFPSIAGMPIGVDSDGDGSPDAFDPDPSDPNIRGPQPAPPAPFAKSSVAPPLQSPPATLAAVASSVAYFGFPVVISLPFTMQATDTKGALVLAKRRLGNKELINLIKGRALNTPIPKSERLIALLPTDFTHPEKANIVLFDGNAVKKLDILFKGDTSSLIFGGPGGNWTASYGDGRLRPLSVPGFSIDGVNRLSISALGGEKVTKKGPVQKTKSATISGSLTITENGQTHPAFVLGGKIIIGGKPLVVITK